MLVDKHYRDILPLSGEGVKGAFDSGRLGFGVDDEVIFLGVRRVGDMLYLVLRQHLLHLWYVFWREVGVSRVATSPC